MAQSEDKKNDTTLTSQVTNLTNATKSPEEIKNMTVIGGTVNQTLNATGGGMNSTNSTGG